MAELVFFLICFEALSIWFYGSQIVNNPNKMAEALEELKYTSYHKQGGNLDILDLDLI